jgi:hypothetical protein
VSGGAAVPQSDDVNGVRTGRPPKHPRGTAMEHYAGIDVALEQSSVCVLLHSFSRSRGGDLLAEAEACAVEPPGRAQRLSDRALRREPAQTPRAGTGTLTRSPSITIIHHDLRDDVVLAGFRSEWRPASGRNRGRLQIGISGRLRRNAQQRARRRLRVSPGCLLKMHRRRLRRPCAGGCERCCGRAAARAARRAPFNQAGEARRATMPRGWWRGASSLAWVATGPRSVDRRARPARRSPSPDCAAP